MNELSTPNVCMYEATTDKVVQKKLSTKDKVNCILENLDGKAGLTVGDIIILGKMSKQQRLTKLGLDANIYDVRVDAKNGIINILEKGASWLRHEINNKKANTTSQKNQTNSSTVTQVKAPVATGKIKENGGEINQGNKTFYYNPGGKLAGIIEKQPDGKEKVMNSTGNVLYYIQSNGEYCTIYYDKSGNLKYIMEDNDDYITYKLEIYDKFGNLSETHSNIYYCNDEIDGYDTDFTSDDDYEKFENERFNARTFNELKTYNKEEHGSFFDPLE